MLDELSPEFRDVDEDLHRNVYRPIVPAGAFDDLTDDPAERGIADEHARRAPTTLMEDAIERPFVPRRSRLPTRFGDGSCGVWYGSRELETTVFETVYWWVRVISAFPASRAGEILSHRRVYWVHCRGLLADLTGCDHPGLTDPASYAYTHRVGAYLRQQGLNGLLARSARRPAGTNAAIFRPEVLSDPRVEVGLVYRWTPGAPEVQVERSPGESWIKVPVLSATQSEPVSDRGPEPS